MDQRVVIRKLIGVLCISEVVRSENSGSVCLDLLFEVVIIMPGRTRRERIT